MKYQVNPDDVVVGCESLMCRFAMVVETPHREIVCLQPGMLHCQFSGNNKLTAIELVFDVMGLMQQIQVSSINKGTPK